MPHSVSVSPDKLYIILKLTGSIDRATALAEYLAAHKMGGSLNIRRYLIDATEAENALSVLEDYQFAYQDMRDEGIDKTARVALLVNSTDHSYDFVATVSRNSGLNVTLFRDRGRAIRHLVEG